MEFQRYAVFFTLPYSAPLAQFGAAWLGWDSATGTEVARCEEKGVDLVAATQAPHKYGFHGTIKAPFRLAHGTSKGALKAAFEGVCNGLAPAALPQLHLARLGRFWALVPQGDTTDLQHLAGRVVKELDMFRAPLTEAEVARRHPDKLSPQQLEYLNTWGYPHVLDAFKFHMTLTNRLDKATGGQVQAVLESALRAQVMPTQIDSLTLMGEALDGRFHQIERWVLG